MTVTSIFSWTWAQFNNLSHEKLYELLAVRQQVFVVEQDCPYQDIDGLDLDAWHLLGQDQQGAIAACARVLAPHTRYADPSIGRLLVCKSARGQGLGRQLLNACLEKCSIEYPNHPVRISAQAYLEKFYRDSGFEPVGSPYDEDGIAHIGMVCRSDLTLG